MATYRWFLGRVTYHSTTYTAYVPDPSSRRRVCRMAYDARASLFSRRTLAHLEQKMYLSQSTHHAIAFAIL